MGIACAPYKLLLALGVEVRLNFANINALAPLALAVDAAALLVRRGDRRRLLVRRTCHAWSPWSVKYGTHAQFAVCIIIMATEAVQAGEWVLLRLADKTERLAQVNATGCALIVVCELTADIGMVVFL